MCQPKSEDAPAFWPLRLLYCSVLMLDPENRGRTGRSLIEFVMSRECGTRPDSVLREGGSGHWRHCSGSSKGVARQRPVVVVFGSAAGSAPDTAGTADPTKAPHLHPVAPRELTRCRVFRAWSRTSPHARIRQ